MNHDSFHGARAGYRLPGKKWVRAESGKPKTPATPRRPQEGGIGIRSHSPWSRLSTSAACKHSSCSRGLSPQTVSANCPRKLFSRTCAPYLPYVGSSCGTRSDIVAAGFARRVENTQWRLTSRSAICAKCDRYCVRTYRSAKCGFSARGSETNSGIPARFIDAGVVVRGAGSRRQNGTVDLRNTRCDAQLIKLLNPR